MKSREQIPGKYDSEPGRESTAPKQVSLADPDELVRQAHRVLVHYLPGTPLPSELGKVRAMLDAHMFGRDKRTQRDDVVRVARQIDSWRASNHAEPAMTPHRLKSK